jgi:hypothetical protein
MSVQINTPSQQPDKSIFDINGRQTYLGNTYGVSVQVALGAEGTEIPFMILQNPLLNKLALFSFTRRYSCVTFGGEINYNVYLNPVLVTAGITVQPINLRPASGNTSTMVASHSPVVTGAEEVQSITTVADVSGSLNNTYFFINSRNFDYYVWFNVGGAGSNPAPGPIGIEVSIPTNSSATSIASAISTALNTLPLQFIASSATNIVTVTTVGSGAVVQASDGGSPTGFIFAVLVPGTALFGTYITTLGASIDPVVDSILYILDAGQNLLVTASASTTGLTGAVELDWYEI